MAFRKKTAVADSAARSVCIGDGLADVTTSNAEETLEMPETWQGHYVTVEVTVDTWVMFDQRTGGTRMVLTAQTTPSALVPTKVIGGQPRDFVVPHYRDTPATAADNTRKMYLRYRTVTTSAAGEIRVHQS